MLTREMLHKQGVSKNGILRFFKALGIDMSRQTLYHRFKFQNWTHLEAYALNRAGIWREPPLVVKKAHIDLLYKQTPQGEKAEPGEIDPDPKVEIVRQLNQPDISVGIRKDY